ncbi:MAG: VWA domain-containing protein [Verrucomicrobia bacterium]|nr:VWA domain-containing protein [Verrucomicrobiota bacterium]
MQTTAIIRVTLALGTVLGLGRMASAQDQVTPPMPAPAEPKVQLAILLDTSSSMDGLIEQAKTQLWKVVNTFIFARQNGQMPHVEVALYEYGNDGLAAATHWIRRLQPLTRDLDKISEELFRLKTNGGQEYCGAVIRQTVADLAWDRDPNTYKAIFIAGNEPFTQGPVDPLEACKEAATKGIVVNTIHCGSEAAGISGKWRDGALAADGSFLIIDSNQAVVHLEAPQDAAIVKLNAQLNQTYLAYGKRAAEAASNQVAQDANSSSRADSGAAVQRVVSKASKNYFNSSWDLVDARKEKDFDINQVPVADLPENMRAMDEAARLAHIDAKAKERADLQQQILDLNRQRDAFVAEKRRDESKPGADTLDSAMTKTVRSQAATKGYKFE